MSTGDFRADCLGSFAAGTLIFIQSGWDAACRAFLASIIAPTGLASAWYSKTMHRSPMTHQGSGGASSSVFPALKPKCSPSRARACSNVSAFFKPSLISCSLTKKLRLCSMPSLSNRASIHTLANMRASILLLAMRRRPNGTRLDKNWHGASLLKQGLPAVLGGNPWFVAYAINWMSRHDR